MWQRIHASGVPYHPAFDEGMSRLSCALCVLASRADLIRAAQLRPELAAAYAEVESEIGHRFRNDLSMTDIIAAARGIRPAIRTLRSRSPAPPGRLTPGQRLYRTHRCS